MIFTRDRKGYLIGGAILPFRSTCHPKYHTFTNPPRQSRVQYEYGQRY